MTPNHDSAQTVSERRLAVTSQSLAQAKSQSSRLAQNTYDGQSHAPRIANHSLFVIPRKRDGFCASIRGHFLELADPNSGHALAPTPDDLVVASIASSLAWSARSFLRARGLPDDVCVTATWGASDDAQNLADISLTVNISSQAKAAARALAASFRNSLEAGSYANSVVGISFDE